MKEDLLLLPKVKKTIGAGGRSHLAPALDPEHILLPSCIELAGSRCKTRARPRARAPKGLSPQPQASLGLPPKSLQAPLPPVSPEMSVSAAVEDDIPEEFLQEYGEQQQRETTAQAPVNVFVPSPSSHSPQLTLFGTDEEDASCTAWSFR